VRGFQVEWEYVRPSSTIANTQCIKAGSGHRQVKLVAWKPKLFLFYIWFVFQGLAFHPRHLLVKHPAKCSLFLSTPCSSSSPETKRLSLYLNQPIPVSSLLDWEPRTSVDHPTRRKMMKNDTTKLSHWRNPYRKMQKGHTSRTS
jgi:hypothetical protein